MPLLVQPLAVPKFAVDLENPSSSKLENRSKYEIWYAQIIERARFRRLGHYKERHHIIPRSLGGGDDDDNLVDLSYWMYARPVGPARSGRAEESSTRKILQIPNS